MTDLLLTTDLANATKEQLKTLVKRVREEFGRDRRSVPRL
jgi:hypothetical protein